MEYFKILSLGLGVYCVCAVVLHYVFHEGTKDFILEKFLPEKRPAGYYLLALLIAALFFYTWFRFFDSMQFGALFVCIFLTLVFTKVIFFIMRYDLMRSLIVVLMSKEKVAMHVLLACSLAVGLALIYNGIQIQ